MDVITYAYINLGKTLSAKWAPELIYLYDMKNYLILTTLEWAEKWTIYNAVTDFIDLHEW